MKFLTKVVETYRLDNEKEVEEFLQELKEDNHFELAKYSSVKKDIKQKGEIVESYIKFDVTKIFNEEKYPNAVINVEYVKE